MYPVQGSWYRSPVRRLVGIALVGLVAAGCDSEDPGLAGGDDGSVTEIDAGADGAPPATGIAPAGTVIDELPGGPTNAVSVPMGGAAVYRVETVPGEHVAFRLDFPSATSGVVLAVARWDGSRPVDIGKTDAGAGLRVLAVLDQGGPRTFWVRVEARSAALTGMLSVTRTPFTEGVRCTADCERLLQLPLPNDPKLDGYDISGAIYRYQFGRRDLVMFLREAGRRMIAAGRVPFLPEDLSQWDGKTPGTDTGSLRHASHQRGKDVDISLYGSDGLAPWRSYCTTRTTSEGRECVPGTRKLFDGEANAHMIGSFFASQRVTMCFLDRELIAALIPGAQQAVQDGLVAMMYLPLYSDGSHVQHWPNHDNHVHIRVSEATTTPGMTSQPVLVFEAP